MTELVLLMIVLGITILAVVDGDAWPGDGAT